MSIHVQHYSRKYFYTTCTSKSTCVRPHPSQCDMRGEVHVGGTGEGEE